MRTAACSLFLAAWAATGCVNLPHLGDEPRPVTAPAVVEPVAAGPGIVAEDITDQNAREMAQALHSEMEREARSPVAPPPAQR